MTDTAAKPGWMEPGFTKWVPSMVEIGSNAQFVILLLLAPFSKSFVLILSTL